MLSPRYSSNWQRNFVSSEDHCNEPAFIVAADGVAFCTHHYERGAGWWKRRWFDPKEATLATPGQLCKWRMKF